MTSRDRTSNEVIRRRMNVKTEIACRSDKNFLKLFSHVEKKDTNYLTKKVENANVSGRTPRKRLKLSWIKKKD